MRLLILLGIIYLGYRALKSWMLQNTAPGNRVFGKTAAEIDDVMIKDPFCEVYFPKRDAVHLNVDGKDLYFCSTECRDKFMVSHSSK